MSAAAVARVTLESKAYFWTCWPAWFCAWLSADCAVAVAACLNRRGGAGFVSVLLVSSIAEAMAFLAPPKPSTAFLPSWRR